MGTAFILALNAGGEAAGLHWSVSEDRLRALGWDDAFAAAFAPYAERCVPGRVTLEHQKIYRVLTEAGEWLARVSGRLRHHAASRASFPAVGDWVGVEPPQDDGFARIRTVLPRASRFSRRSAGDRTEEQVVAANIDIVFLVTGLDSDYNPRRIERYLLVAADSGATPVIVLNKADLVEDPAVHLEEIRGLAPNVAGGQEVVSDQAVDDRALPHPGRSEERPGSADPERVAQRFERDGLVTGHGVNRDIGGDAPHLVDEDAGIRHQIRLVQHDDRRGATVRSDEEVALDAARVVVAVEPGDEKDDVDVGGDDLLLGAVARGPA